MDNVYALQESTLKGLADAMRNHFDTNDTFTPLEMIDKLYEREVGDIFVNSNDDVHIDPVTGGWARPSKWPNLDALAAEIEGDQDCVYFTYDLSLHPDYHWLGMRTLLSSGTEWYLDRYDEGDFVHTHLVGNSGDYIRYDLINEPDDSDVQVWRLTSNGQISKFGFVSQTETEAMNFDNNCQPCVDRAGTLPWCARLSGGISRKPTEEGGATIWLEHDAMVFGKNVNVTNLASCWSDAHRLIELDTSQWDTSNWHVTSLNGAWNRCYNLRKLELNNLDTHNWAVTNIAETWRDCKSLEKLDLNNWDTSNWAVTTLNSTWYSCFSLQELKIDQWDTSNWAVNRLDYTWYHCYSLRQLNLNNWNIDNWPIKDIRYVWNECYNLLKLGIDNWNTDNWTITSLSHVWNNCYNLKKLNLNNWNTTNWQITDLSYTWANCFDLQELKIDQWNTTNWVLPNLNNTWFHCHKLKELNLNNWDTSNWEVTSLSNTWNSCYSLKQLNINNWNTTNWNINNLAHTWNSCYSLQELCLTDWDTSNWQVTLFSYVWQHCYNLKILDISNWDTSNWTITSNNNSFDSLVALQICRLPESIPMTGNIDYPRSTRLVYYSGYDIQYDCTFVNCPYLTSDSLRTIINRLPIVSSEKTITLGPQNLLKLTESDIAIATNKGWTVE